MKYIPLAAKMRPKRIEDIIGQQHLVGENKPIRRMIEMNRIASMILTGPPGTGKTSIAEVIANTTTIPFEKMNAVSIAKKDLEQVVKKARENEHSILLYIDEIHRMTRPQSEVLLPAVEDGDIVLVGSTTESASHSVPPAILSRCTVYETKQLTKEDVIKGLKRTLNDKENGLGTRDIVYEEEHLEFISNITGGDFRASINILDNLYTTYSEDGKLELSIDMIEESTHKKFFSSNGDNSEYNLLSAFHKSCRGSDVNAALYYMTLLLEMGAMESLCRRILIIQAEDVFTNLNLGTHMLTEVTIAQKVGYPECRLNLARAVIELCLTPKSNSATKAITRVLSDIKQGKVYDVPGHLKDGHYKGAPKETRNYLFPHDYKDDVLGSWVKQDYLPNEMKGTEYYEPSQVGHEKNLSRMYDYILQKNRT